MTQVLSTHTGGDADARLIGTKGEKWMESSFISGGTSGKKE